MIGPASDADAAGRPDSNRPAPRCVLLLRMPDDVITTNPSSIAHDDVRALLLRAQEAGSVTQRQLDALAEELELDATAIDELQAKLDELGVEIAGAEDEDDDGASD